MYEIKYKELPNNLLMVQVKFKEKTIIYINIKKDRGELWIQKLKS